jgi:hypothetical protein
MNALLCLAVIVAVFGSGLAQTRPPPDPCRTCQIIVNIARHHFNNTVYTQADLQAQLLMECDRLAQFEGQAASDHCKQVVNNNIATIFNDMSTNKTPLQTCQDVGECQQKAMRVPQVLKRQKRQRPHDPCRTCELVVNIARHHFHNNITDKAALQAQLLLECTNIAQFEGQEASAHCTQIVNQNIDKIFQDMTTPGYSARHTCEDIKECPPRTTMMPALKRQKRQRPHDPCRTCEIIVNIARHHFHNNITDQGALQAQLLVECQHLVQTESQAAADHCKMIVTNNIAKIFQDMSTNHTARQTCTDINECHAPSSPPRHK